MIEKYLFWTLPVLLAAFFASIIPRKLEERKRFNEAAKIFRNDFLLEIAFLEHNTALPGNERTYTTLDEFLRAGYTFRHLKAFETFKPYLSPVNRKGIDKAWQEYCCRPDDPNALYFEQYSTKSVSREREEELKRLALERIEAILKFAKHK
jgi:hypothetical protein